MQYGSWLGWQIDYLLWLQNMRDVTHHVFDGFFTYITVLGEITIPIMIICLFYWVLNKRAAQYMFISWMYGFMINLFLKSIACIYRPWILDSRVHPVPAAIPAATGYSFPSGHTAGVMSVFGSIAVSFWKNKFIRYASIIIVLLVMFSRNYLGVHTPQDVVVSFVVACFILWGINNALNWVDSDKQGGKRDLIFVEVTFLFTVLITLYIVYKPYPVHFLFGQVLYSPADMIHHSVLRSGVLYGGLLGWILERRYVDFQPSEGSLLRKIMRYAFGLVCLVALHSMVNIVSASSLPYSQACAFVQYFILGCFITFIYPLISKKFSL